LAQPPYEEASQFPSAHEGLLSKPEEPIDALNEESNFLLFFDWQAGQITSSRFVDDL
jgi:hypothetical protein